MSNKFFGFVGIIIASGLILLGIFYLLSGIFHWNVSPPSPQSILNIVAGAACLLWLLFILKVPWDLYFETNSVLFEMKRSEEKNIAVKTDRRTYLQRMRIITAIIAIGSHIISAAIIAGLTYWTNGQLGYYFAFFYILATLLRPASQAYTYLINKLHEIKGEILYPREDVIKLRVDLTSTLDRLKALEERIKRDESRLTASEETAKNLRTEINNVNSALECVDRNFQNRMQLLTTEVERSLSKAFDQQDIINGLRAFSRLIKQA
jgi:hypothetical protein